MARTLHNPSIMQTHSRWPWLLCATCLALSLPLSHAAAQGAETFEPMPDMLDRRLDSEPLPARVDDNVAPNNDDEEHVPDPNALPPLDLVARFAVASPVGTLGVELSLNVTRYLALRLGAGDGAGGEQLSALIALRLPRRRESVGIASGVSVGGYQTFFYEGIHIHGSRTREPIYRWNRVGWWNSEVFFERRGDHAFVRPFIGLGVPLAQPSPDSCDPGDLTCEPEKARIPLLILLGVAVGWG